MSYGLQIRSAILFIAPCAILGSIALGMVALGGGKSDPLRAYRDAAATGAARAVVVEAGAAGLLVSYPDERGQEVRAAVLDFGLLGRDWRRAYPVGSSLDVVEVAGRPGSPAVPQALLLEVPPPPDAPSPVPGLLAMLVGVGGGLAVLRATLRVPMERWLRWYPGQDRADAAPASATKRLLRIPDGTRRIVTPQGKAITRKLAAGTLMFLALPLFAAALPPVVRTTRDALASRDWPTTPGTVIESRLRPYATNSGADVKYAHVVFAYEVGGRRYRASTPEWSLITAGWGADAEGIVARYPRGSEVLVHYDPAAPQRAVLRPGPEPASTAGHGAVFAVMALAWLWGLRVLLRPLPPEAAPAA